jgi:chemotaxis protein methyltransferase CheR
VSDRECIAFLQWALPRLGMRWAGYRRVRRQVRKRIARRLRKLNLPDVDTYRRHLEARPEEWEVLDGLCRVTISRFYRDRGVFDCLRDTVLPSLAAAASARGERVLHAWLAGCASGEEAYTLKAVWELCLHPRFPELPLRLLATDADADLLARARRGRFGESSLKDFPEAWRGAVFERCDGGSSVRPAFREGVELQVGDLRRELPEGPFHVILCRNVAFTYFDEPLQRRTAARLAERCVAGGALVIGIHEAIPDGDADFRPWNAAPGIYRRTDGGSP